MTDESGWVGKEMVGGIGKDRPAQRVSVELEVVWPPSLSASQLYQ